MENTLDNRKKIASIVVSIIDPRRIKTILALRYMEDLENDEVFASTLQALKEKNLLPPEESK